MKGNLSRARQNIIVRIYLFSQKLKILFSKYLLGQYLFGCDNIFLKYFLSSRKDTIFLKISSRKMKRYFLKRYILKKISFRFCEKIFLKYIIFSTFFNYISQYRENFEWLWTDSKPLNDT